MGQVSLVFIHFTPFTSLMGSTRVGSLGNGRQRRVDPISILYFTTFLPAFSAIWRRRYPLFRTLDTGKRPSFFYDKGKWKIRPLVRTLTKQTLLNSTAMHGGRDALHRPDLFDSPHHFSKASVRSGASYNGVSGRRRCPSWLSFPNIKRRVPIIEDQTAQ